jgi:WD40 repeat protein
MASMLLMVILFAACQSDARQNTPTSSVSPSFIPTKTNTPTVTQTFTSTPPPTITNTPTITPSPTPQRLAYEPIIPGNVRDLSVLVSKRTGHYYDFIDNEHFLTISDNNVCIANIFEPYTEKCTHFSDEKKNYQAESISPDLSLLATTDVQDNIYVWDLENEKLLTIIEAPKFHSFDYRIPRFISNDYLVFLDAQNIDQKTYFKTSLWSVDLQKTVKKFDDREISVYYYIDAQVASKRGKLIGVYKNNDLGKNILEIWDTQNLSLVQEIELHDQIDSVHISSSGTYVVVIGSRPNYQNIHVYRIEDGEYVFSGKSAGDDIEDFAFSSDEALFTYVSRANDVNIWETEDWTLERIVTGNPRYGYSKILFSPNGEYLLAAPNDSGQIKFEAPDNKNFVWDLKTGDIIGRPLGSQGGLMGGFSPDSEYLVLESWTEILTYRVNDMQTLTKQNKIYGKPLLFSPQGNYLASGARGGIVLLWDAHTGEFVRQIGEYDYTRYYLGMSNLTVEIAFSPAEEVIAVGTWSGEISLWDVQTGERLVILKEGVGPGESPDRNRRLTHLIFSHDGSMIAARNGPIISIWKVSNGKILTGIIESCQYKGSSYQYYELPVLSFSPDDQYLSGDCAGYYVDGCIENDRDRCGTIWKQISYNSEDIHYRDESEDIFPWHEDIHLPQIQIRMKESYHCRHFSYAFHPNNQRLKLVYWSPCYGNNRDPYIQVYENREEGHMIREIPGGDLTSFQALDIAFSPDDTLVAITRDNSFQIWGIEP